MSRLPDRIIEALYDRHGRSIWLDELLTLTGASARSLPKALEELAQRGHRIEQTPAGLHLLWPSVLDAHLIGRKLPTRRIGRHVLCFGEVDSANDVAFDAAAKALAGEAIVITAESQKAGRGRLGRKWQSPKGSGILCSIGLSHLVHPAHEALTIAGGLAVAQGVEDAAGVATQLEWPNDVTCDGAKLAGVLVEVRRLQRRPVVVIGFGVNVTAGPSPEAVGRKTTCLAQCGGGTLDRNTILRAILVRMDGWLAQIEAGHIGPLHDEWIDRCGMIHQRITIERGGRRITGRVADVQPLEGIVLVDDADHNHILPASSSSVIR
jgi:BirA family biotin operon repressor/biotin-[acetyl-CoA-carboxylase] ligase